MIIRKTLSSEDTLYNVAETKDPGLHPEFASHVPIDQVIREVHMAPRIREALDHAVWALEIARDHGFDSYEQKNGTWVSSLDLLVYLRKIRDAYNEGFSETVDEETLLLKAAY